MRNVTPKQIKTEILSGLTVSLALVPEAVAFAFVAGVHPLVGLYAAFIVGLITSVLGGRPGMISGATGALAVVMVSLVTNHGIEYLFAAVILMGIIQMIAGALRLGKFIRIVPHPVMLGFVNGLAIVIFLAQLSQFQTLDSTGSIIWLSGNKLYIMLALIALTMAIIHYLPRFTKAIPSALVAILVIFGITELCNIDTKAVGDMASIAGGFPKFHIPIIDLNLETLKIILPYSIILAGVGLIESLLALTLVDEITETRGRNSRECGAQGIANVVTGFFGGMGGCAMIGQTMINISSGARHRLSGITAAIFLLSFIIFAAPLIEAIPIAALVGVMFMVVIGTFAWSSLRIMNKIPKSDAFVIVLVSATTVFFDLAAAVFVGVIVSALVYAWNNAHHITAVINEDSSKNTKIYDLYGPIFFGSVASFKDLFHPNTDPDNIIINFEHSRVWDHSGLEALEQLAKKYNKIGKIIKYQKLSIDCANLLEKSGCIIDRNNESDPHYEVVMDRSYEPGTEMDKIKEP
ncbi:MAG: SulP family inorganic anion transporter [Rickettsiales bacterium]|jgi:sulfate permease, SulP family|nr:SulP family inorganic anion transporter [Rickettsiales bacterium]